MKQPEEESDHGAGGYEYAPGNVPPYVSDGDFDRGQCYGATYMAVF